MTRTRCHDTATPVDFAAVAADGYSSFVAIAADRRDERAAVADAAAMLSVVA